MCDFARVLSVHRLRLQRIRRSQRDDDDEQNEVSDDVPAVHSATASNVRSPHGIRTSIALPSSVAQTTS